MPASIGIHDSVSIRNSNRANREAHSLLARANNAWENLRRVRERAERTKDYCFGKQWNDFIDSEFGPITEAEWIRRQGNIPFVNNIMISIYSSLTGMYDKQGSEPQAFARDVNDLELSDLMSATMQCNWQNLYVPLVLSKVYATWLWSGIAMVRESYEMQDDGIPDSETQFVNPFKAFWESGTDPNLKDLTLIGQLCDVPKEQLYQSFARPEYDLSVDDINSIYHIPVSSSWYDDNSNKDQYNEKNELQNLSFTTPNTPHTYRVIEVWTKESKERYQCWDPIATSQEKAYFRIEKDPIELAAIEAINVSRIQQYIDAGVADKAEVPLIQITPFVDVYWYYTFMAPDGTVLCEGETPFEHKSHPFTLMTYGTNGEIHPYMSFAIDQQRIYNRTLMMWDMATRSATKGVTIVPEECVPDDMTKDEFTESLTRYDRVAYYKLNRVNPNARPDIIMANAANLGLGEMMQMVADSMHQIYNVSGALQGRTPSPGTSASRYGMETENSTTSLFSILSDFSVFTEKIALKKCENIKQFYEDGRLIFGNKSGSAVLKYNKMAVRDVKFKFSIKEGAATAAYQQRIQESLDGLLERQAIDILTYLDNADLPFAKDLAQQIRMQQQQGMLGQQPLQVQGADMQQVQKAQQIMSNPQQQ